MIYDTLYSILEKHQEIKNKEELESDIIMTFSDDNLLNKIDVNQIDVAIDDLVIDLTEHIRQAFDQK